MEKSWNFSFYRFELHYIDKYAYSIKNHQKVTHSIYWKGYCYVYLSLDTYMHVKAILKVYKYGDILWPSLVYLLKLEAIWGNYFLTELCTFPISGHAFYYDINIVPQNYRFHRPFQISDTEGWLLIYFNLFLLQNEL